MKTCHPFFVGFAGTWALAVMAATPADLPNAQHREACVRQVQQLTREIRVIEFAATPNPFNPPGFDAPAEENGEQKRPFLTPANRSDREILEALALRFPAGGTISRGGRMFLTTGREQYSAGQKLIVSEREVELIEVTATTFTLRYRNEVFTRPVR